MATRTSIEDVKALIQFIKTTASNDYTPPFLSCHQYEDLVEFYYVTQINLQQLRNLIENEQDTFTIKLLADSEESSLKIADWLTKSWHNNTAYRSKPIKISGI